jgi:hypothetical protein
MYVAWFWKWAYLGLKAANVFISYIVLCLKDIRLVILEERNEYESLKLFLLTM